ncbi:MAG: nitroreductase family protein [Rhodoferax sp.]|nr:nitroreductase family protein [Rhodoferax sp.]
MQRRNFIRLIGGGTVVAATSLTGLAGCSSAIPAEAIEAWRGPDAGLANTDVRRWILSYAILAPHSHNLQSWVADLRTPGEITLRCDPTRLLPETDPFNRQIVMSHGTFIELLDMAAKEQGLRADITLFPEGAFGADKIDARPVARIRLVPDASVQKDPLFAQVLLRHTNRKAYDLARPVPPTSRAALAATVKSAPIRVGQVGPEDSAAMAQHRRVAKEAWRIELVTPRTVMESFHVLRVGASEIAQHRDGISLTSPMVVALERLGLFDRTKAPAPDSSATTGQIKDFNANLDATPGFVWMVTPDNSRVTQIEAGRAWARVQLAATAQGLAMQPLSQALQEYAEQKQMYADIHKLAGATRPGETVQMWARVGYAPAVEPAPRRKLQDFVKT